MIHVKFVGGAKKSFSREEMMIDKSDISIQELLDLLLTLKPRNTPALDDENILVAINSADSSAMDGKMTLIKNNDVVSIIPIIHGGSNKKITLSISKKSIQIVEIRGQKNIGVTFLDDLRKKFPSIQFQAISSNYILNIYHLNKILIISFESMKKNVLLSNKLETDLLMRFALTGQISNAINVVGIKPKKNFVLIAIGNKKILDKLYKELAPFTIELFSKDNSLFLKKHFNITNTHIDSVLSKRPLEDLLVEKSTVLF